jgi:hypothetical protein
VYGESNGVIWDVAVNQTAYPFDDVYVVGAFDTESKSSQLQFCSVGQFDGMSFAKVSGNGVCFLLLSSHSCLPQTPVPLIILHSNKVGEGLCPRGEDAATAMNIYTSVLGSGGDLFVGGTFESRVWDGHHFVNVHNAAHFDAQASAWLPLVEGKLHCLDGTVAR